MLNQLFQLRLRDRILQDYVFAKDTIRIGRDASADVVIANSAVSRMHAVIQFKNGACYIMDMKSSNGIEVQGQPVKACELKPGMSATIGKFTVKYVGPSSVHSTLESPASAGSGHERHAHMAAQESDMATVVMSPPDLSQIPGAGDKSR